MTLRLQLCKVAAVLALSQMSLPVFAGDKDPFEKLDAINPEVLFKGIIREDDVSMLFKHLRESMAASARGEQAPEPSEAINRRAEVVKREIAARGSVLMGVMLSAFEAAAKQMVREGFSEFSGRSNAR